MSLLVSSLGTSVTVPPADVRRSGSRRAIIDEKAGTNPDDKILLREIVHACVVVRNVEKTARNLSDKFGIGPWDVHIKSYPYYFNRRAEKRVLA
jgi:hypothetical protein